MFKIVTQFRESAFERFNGFVFETDQFAKHIFAQIIFWRALSHRAVRGLYTLMLIFVYDKRCLKINRRTCSRIHYRPEKEPVIQTLLVRIRQQ
jgi:hypothetical protein